MYSYYLYIIRIHQTTSDYSTSNNLIILNDISDIKNAMNVIKYMFYVLITLLYICALFYLTLYIY